MSDGTNLQQWHCAVEGCPNPKGKYTTHCVRHYQEKWRRSQPLRPCAVPSCHRFAHSGGLCSTHAYRLRKNGDPNVVQRRVLETKSYVQDGIGYLELTQGYYAKIDAKHFERLNQFKWQLLRNPSGRLYATRRIRLPNGRGEFRQLHHDIIQPRPGFTIDHIDRDGLNNLETNLREVTPRENNINRGPLPNNTSGYKGVGWFRPAQKWRARISLNGKEYSLGYFDDPKDAARAYNRKARELGFIYVPPDPD